MPNIETDNLTIWQTLKNACIKVDNRWLSPNLNKGFVRIKTNDGDDIILTMEYESSIQYRNEKKKLKKSRRRQQRLKAREWK